MCLVTQAVLDDPDSGIFQLCYSGIRPLFLVRRDCDSRQQSVFGFCCYPNDSHNSSELCNTEEAFTAWRRSMETPSMTSSTVAETSSKEMPSMTTPSAEGPTSDSNNMGSNAVIVHSSICIAMFAVLCMLMNC